MLSAKWANPAPRSNTSEMRRTLVPPQQPPDVRPDHLGWSNRFRIDAWSTETRLSTSSGTGRPPLQVPVPGACRYRCGLEPACSDRLMRSSLSRTAFTECCSATWALRMHCCTRAICTKDLWIWWKPRSQVLVAGWSPKPSAWPP